MKIIKIVIPVLICMSSFFLLDAAKTVYIPNQVSVETNGMKTTMIRNMSIYEMYEAFRITIIDNFIYLMNHNSMEVVKISLQGNVLARIGKKPF